MLKPECAEWSIWIGKEIEGQSDIGVETLFIRRLNSTAEEFEKLKDDLGPKLTRRGTIKRVWFCKEFQNWPLLRVIAKHFKTVCLEVTPKGYDNLPREFKTDFIIYLKVPFMLKKGDHVCVGAAFQDESFQIGKGNRVSPEQYANDVRVA